MKRKGWTIATSVVLMAGLLTGCGTSSSATNGSPTSGSQHVTLKFIGWDPASVYQPAIDAYEKKNPNVTVEYTPLVENDSNATLKKLDLMYASGQDFDMFTLNSTTTFSQRVSNGMIEPLDTYLAKEGVKYQDEYNAEQMTFNGKRYSLPGKAGPWMIILNKTQLDAANLPVPKSWTWDDFQTYAKKLTQGSGASKQYGTFFYTWKDYFLLAKYSSPTNQGIMADDGATPDVNNPLLKKSLELRYQMENVDKTATPYQDVVTQKIPYRDAYFQGKASMLPTGPWMIQEAGGTDKIPATFVTAFAPWPTNNKGDEQYSFGGADSLVISSKSKNKEESYKFLRFLSTEGIVLTKQLSAWKKADVNQEVDQIIASTKSPDKIDKASLINVLNVTKLPQPPIVPSYESDIETAFIADAEKYMLGQTDINTTLGNMKVNLQKVVDANKK
ncbi:MAG: hypothetical protein JWN30_457 [Bacilli bacterium]|nr:hypothetical protein [Bacilli bacterium]